MKQRKTRGKKGKSGQWADHLTFQARADNYPARSVYKLMEIQKKFQVMKKGDSILDLGCAPGSWMLYAARVAGSDGRVLGIDLKPVEIDLPRQATALVKDILALDRNDMPETQILFNIILSDMAPSTTGRKDVDALRSFELCRTALKVADDYLAPGGHFVCKIFQGNEFEPFNKAVRQMFGQVKIFKPESCRKASKEIYIIGKEKL